ncbi:unknown similar to AMEV261 [Mythimna separata entomopoxvirus 'L']|uniref:G-protein coupled receptors family 2 profile 2 domain-containing protein n=1 Tax=Mythimna separata entomopoxvirus 'L' TaxID=1293572 RepID=A0A916KQ14_9POXV|nr:unknown similar to AMEV261 [Mythimna separata entomopoxvirus 'L']CCU56240.1 unknown similar to AMEV261 [Mythimna separata entomopoxvirus 'L']
MYNLKILFIICVCIYFCKCEYSCCKDKYILKNNNTYYCFNEIKNISHELEFKCPELYNIAFIKNNTHYPFIIDNNNKLVFKKKNRRDNIYDNYCINKSKKNHICIILLLCKKNIIPTIVYCYCSIISSTLLYITAIFYAYNKKNSIYNKIIINLCCCLGTGMLLFGIMNIIPYSNMTLCAIKGFLEYFFIISSFFWFNSLSIQILLNINQYNNYNNSMLYYYIYSWLFPAVLTFILAIINFIPGDHIKPLIGLNTCWFYDIYEQWKYLYSIMIILTLLNIGIFCYIIRLLYYNVYSIKIKNKIKIIIKLFIIMGLSWIFEAIGSITYNNIIFEIIDLINILQGVFIFIVLVISNINKKENNIENIVIYYEKLY